MLNYEVQNNYDGWHQEIAAEESNDAVLNDPWYQTVIKNLPEDFNGKILEIGCGRGDFTRYLANRFKKAQIIGTDFSKKAIEIAESKRTNSDFNLTFKTENAEALTFDDGSFDLIVSCETMEHVINPRLMAAEIFRVLKTNGQCILTTENYFNGLILSWIQSWLTRKPFNSGAGIQPHENFMLFFKTQSFFKKAGFKKIRTQSNHFQWLILPGINPAKFCTTAFKSPLLNNLFKPFGRHFSYFLTK